ncbi:MAG: hypothetical protein IPO95_07450 [Rhodanobacteraceae bacterium]|nr:hypothetical protein [Rhodanobacteraceae bacterium]
MAVSRAKGTDNMKMSGDAAQLLANYTAAHFTLDAFDDVVVHDAAWKMVAKLPRELNADPIIDRANFSRLFGEEIPNGRLYVLDLSPEVSPNSSPIRGDALSVPHTWSAFSELQDRLLELDGFMVDLIVFDESLAHALVRRLESVIMLRLCAGASDTRDEARD